MYLAFQQQGRKVVYTPAVEKKAYIYGKSYTKLITSYLTIG